MIPISRHVSIVRFDTPAASAIWRLSINDLTGLLVSAACAGIAMPKRYLPVKDSAWPIELSKYRAFRTQPEAKSPSCRYARKQNYTKIMSSAA
jgi:hypothetical protein